MLWRPGKLLRLNLGVCSMLFLWFLVSMTNAASVIPCSEFFSYVERLSYDSKSIFYHLGNPSVQPSDSFR